MGWGYLIKYIRNLLKPTKFLSLIQIKIVARIKCIILLYDALHEKYNFNSAHPLISNLSCYLYLSWTSRHCVCPPKSLVYQHSTESIQPRSFQLSKLLEHAQDQPPSHWNSESCWVLPKLVQIFEINCFLLHPFPSTSRCQECLLPWIGMDSRHRLSFNQCERITGCKWSIQSQAWSLKDLLKGS